MDPATAVVEPRTLHVVKLIEYYAKLESNAGCWALRGSEAALGVRRSAGAFSSPVRSSTWR